MSVKFKNFLGRICPTYAIIPLIGSFVMETVVYEGTKLLIQNRHHYDFTTSFDRKVPVISSFAFIYYGCYLFWIINFILFTKIGEKHFYQTIFAVYLSYVICAIIFVAMPTTNVRPQVTGNSLGDMVLRVVYWSDTPENLFPSIHCSVSWFCMIGIWRRKEIPSWYRIFSVIFTGLIIVSTQVIKQHYIVDVFGGIALAQACYCFSKKTNYYCAFRRFFQSVNKKLRM